jgi:hypothetical protein
MRAEAPQTALIAERRVGTFNPHRGYQLHSSPLF